jgi:TPR repeat protein
VARLRRHVENEQPEAMKQLGDFYRDGDFGLVKSSKKAAKLYLRAAELGEVYAMVALGALYETGGNGVKRDGKKAMKMYREATDRGLALAQSNLSNLLSVDGQYMESFRYCKLAADQGYTQAQYNAGYCYENAEGVGRNLDEAKRLYALVPSRQGLRAWNRRTKATQRVILISPPETSRLRRLLSQRRAGAAPASPRPRGAKGRSVQGAGRGARTRASAAGSLGRESAQASTASTTPPPAIEKRQSP